MTQVIDSSTDQPRKMLASGNGVQNVPQLAPPRLPYHPAVEERFGIDRASWKALVEAIFPNAQTTESVILALSYCRARKLDAFKRNVHIVATWNREAGRMVDTIWPGIGELRTTAFRTGEYAGRDAAEFGPILDERVGKVQLKFPEWAQVTVHRIVKGQKVAFSGPRVYWLETYAVRKRDDDSPNEMWETRPRGQIEKCAEAAALRAAFPEEIGSDHIGDEVQHFKAVESKISDAPQRGAAGVLAKIKPRAIEHEETQVIDASTSNETIDHATGEVMTAGELDVAVADTTDAADAANQEVAPEPAATESIEQEFQSRTGEGLRLLCRDRAKDHKIDRKAFDGGFFKWALAWGGKIDDIPLAQWLNLWRAVCANKFDVITGKISE